MKIGQRKFAEGDDEILGGKKFEVFFKSAGGGQLGRSAPVWRVPVRALPCAAAAVRRRVPRRSAPLSCVAYRRRSAPPPLPLGHQLMQNAHCAATPSHAINFEANMESTNWVTPFSNK